MRSRRRWVGTCSVRNGGGATVAQVGGPQAHGKASAWGAAPRWVSWLRRSSWLGDGCPKKHRVAPRQGALEEARDWTDGQKAGIYLAHRDWGFVVAPRHGSAQQGTRGDECQCGRSGTALQHWGGDWGVAPTQWSGTTLPGTWLLGFSEDSSANWAGQKDTLPPVHEFCALGH